MAKTIKNVICTFCGTLCDDLEIDVTDDEKKIITVRNACSIGAEKYLHVSNPGRVVLPRMRQADGTYKDVSYEEAINFTTKTLLKAKKPLFYGCSMDGPPPTVKQSRQGLSWIFPSCNSGYRSSVLYSWRSQEPC